MLNSFILKIELLFCAIVFTVLVQSNFLLAGKFDPNTWKTITKEQFTQENVTNKTVMMQKLYVDTNLAAPENSKALQILTWALLDKESSVRKIATWETVEYSKDLRQVCRGKNVGKLPIKREVIEELLTAVKANFDTPDLISRSDAIRAHIWIRGSGKECSEIAIKLINDLSIDVTEQWGRREWLLHNMVHTGSKEAEELLSYPHPNSRKKGEPVIGKKLVPIKYKANDNTWFDFLDNSLQ